ncbi:MAG TPA: lipid-transfer protein [Acidimicrobiia bacterium]
MKDSLADAASIVGVGQTEFSKAAGRSETRLACEAIVAAVADAGLHMSDIDGLATFTIDPVEETELARALGIQDVHWSSRMPYGGAGSQGILLHAAAAVATGVARAVVVYRSVRARSGSRFGAATVAARPTSSHSGTTAMQWCTPFGLITPASWMSLNATRYMHQFGVKSEDFGRAVVQLRAYASTNPNSHFFEHPITLADHQASRWIAEPSIRLFDCCQETDGAVALVIVPTNRAADSPQPVRISAAASVAPFETEVATDHYSRDLSVMTSSASLARQLFGAAGLAVDDLDVAMIYDAFTPVLLMQLEALGFCGPGEAKDFIAEGGLGPDAAIPCNTNGGLIGEGYIHGVNLTLEAVHQLRGDAVNQVSDAEVALVAANRSGVILTRG